VTTPRIDELRRRAKGKAYPFSNETCMALLDVVEAARNIAGLSSGAWPKLAEALAALEADKGEEGA
jgi:hypothetical protein